MVDPINLNRARKARDKAEAKAKAAANRGVFGLPKPERDKSRADAAKSAKDLEGKKRE